jgi:hypothetical protein
MVGPKHWLRPNAHGTVRAYTPRRGHVELIEFDDIFPGGGFTLDDSGDKQHLYIDQAELIPLKAKRKKAA